MKTRNKVLLALLALVLVTGLGAKMYSTITMGDDEWIGLGASAGRIVFDDQATDEVNIMDANVGLGTAEPGYRLTVVGNAAGNDGIALANAGAGNPQISFDNPIGALKAAITWVEDTRLQLYVLGADIMAWTNVGVGVGLPGPTSLLHVEAADGTMVDTWTAFIENKEATAGDNWGLGIKAGTDANDAALRVEDTSTNVLFVVRGDGNVGIGSSPPSYDLDVAGDIRALDTLLVGGAADDIDARANMPIAIANNGQGGYFFYNVDISADTDLTGLYSQEANVERQVWVRWLVYDVTATTEHYGETVLDYSGGVSSVVIADEGANDLLFKVARGAPPNLVGYLCLDVVGNHTYEVALMTMWH